MWRIRSWEKKNRDLTVIHCADRSEEAKLVFLSRQSTREDIARVLQEAASLLEGEWPEGFEFGCLEEKASLGEIRRAVIECALVMKHLKLT